MVSEAREVRMVFLPPWHSYPQCIGISDQEADIRGRLLSLLDLQ
jgi:hypothetical protein